GQHISSDQLLPGDLVFWNDGGPIHHVAIWMGNNTVIHAPHSGAYVEVVPMWWSGYAGAVRPGT
ncbi:MAG: C40 family peptidase, partial [Geodermatophilaceae bacterium]